MRGQGERKVAAGGRHDGGNTATMERGQPNAENHANIKQHGEISGT